MIGSSMTSLTPEVGQELLRTFWGAMKVRSTSWPGRRFSRAAAIFLGFGQQAKKTTMVDQGLTVPGKRERIV
jgi:hypothetical protein